MARIFLQNCDRELLFDLSFQKLEKHASDFMFKFALRLILNFSLYKI